MIGLWRLGSGCGEVSRCARCGLLALLRRVLLGFAVGWGLAGTAPVLGAQPHPAHTRGAQPQRPAHAHDAAPQHSASAALSQSVVVDAAVSSVDYENGTAAFKNIVVSQGGIRVTAERAQVTGLDFESSHWRFDGQVLVTLEPGGTLRSDHAIVDIRDNRVTQATATGDPAQFEQQRAGSRPALHGHAQRIVFDAVARTVRLSGKASLSDGRNEITGPVLVYGLRGESVTAISPS
ncbi:MAG: LptA/OstA family protein, partial [Steroidobacteraceae bacterium]